MTPCDNGYFRLIIDQGLTDQDTCAYIVRSLNLSRLDFGNSLLDGISSSSVKRLQKLQNHAAHLFSVSIDGTALLPYYMNFIIIIIIILFCSFLFIFIFVVVLFLFACLFVCLAFVLFCFVFVFFLNFLCFWHPKRDTRVSRPTSKTHLFYILVFVYAHDIQPWTKWPPTNTSLTTSFPSTRPKYRENGPFSGQHDDSICHHARKAQ